MHLLCHEIQASLALLTGVPWCLTPDPADAHQLADVGGTIDDKMVDDGKLRRNKLVKDTKLGLPPPLTIISAWCSAT